MKPHLTVHLDHAGHPYALVPDDWLWELVEYLSYQRLHVSYHFGGPHFAVTFQGQNPQQVQELLDHWAAEEHETCTAQSV